MRFLSVILLYTTLILPTSSHASGDGREGFNAIKQCVMQNDVRSCEGVMTPSSHALFRRFVSYKLMPCLPTHFSYVSEQKTGAFTVVKASMPAGSNKTHHFRMAFTGKESNVKLDVPESLRIGLGTDWQKKIDLAEKLFLFIQANAGGNLKCDDLTGLVKK